MIPLKLQIRNFLSYGPETQTIDFSSYPLICLSGKNGHGKSALLDAMTWAIWGQARKISNTAKADQGLLHLGQSTMMVTFDFECNANTYRIKREYAHLYGKPYTSLEFGVLDGDTIRPLTDKTIRSTQAVIEQTLHISFDSFINSAFLRQGHSNEFSKKTPKERKEILGAILGLDTYESIRKRALEKSKQLLTQKQALGIMYEKSIQEIMQLEDINKSIVIIQEELEVHKKKVTQEHNKLAQFHEKKKEFVELDKNYELIKHAQSMLEINQSTLYTKLTALRTQWKKVHAQKCAAHQLPALEQLSKQLSDQVLMQQQSIQKLLAQKEDYLVIKEKMNHMVYAAKTAHQQEILARNFELEKDRTQLSITQKAYAELNNALAKLKRDTAQAQQELHQKNQRADALCDETKDIEALERQFEKRKEFYHTYVAKRNALQTTLAELDQKQQLVHVEDDPSCPLCEQNLSAARKRFLKQKFHDQVLFTQHQYQRLAHIAKKLKTILIDQHTQLEELKKKKNEYTVLRNHITQLTTHLNNIQQEEATKLEEVHVITLALQQLQEIVAVKQKELADKPFDEASLETNQDYKKCKTQCMELESHIATFESLQANVHALMRQLQDIRTTIAQFQDLSNQIAQQTNRAQEISNLCHELKEYKKKLAEHDRHKNEIEIQLEAFKVQLAHEQTVQTVIDQLTNKKETILQELGNLTAQKTKLMALEQEIKAQETHIQHINQRIDDFTIIAHATGKDGIQALLIEEAIPEIEQEANYLLSKLTNNQAQLFIESLKDLKKGGSKETLDIKISDTLGIRPYELFSGGETFRIDFALRIAISKLLARRAGTSLQTLIIDEGFGSQDEDGLSNIMDSIYKIQEDFAKIIIVSHLPSMKEQFPVHFVVEKGAQGSNVTVIEHD